MIRTESITTNSLSSKIVQVHTIVISFIRKCLRWSWISIVTLGIGSNLLINLILDYKYQRPLVSFSLEEYINAIIASFVLLSGTRLITKRLDNRVPWGNGVRRRLVIQLMLHLFFIITALNIMVISITYFFYGGFYEFGDLMVINISVVSLVFFFTLIDTGIYFHNNWLNASSTDDSIIINAQKPVQVSLGKSQHFVSQENINCAIGQSGLVVIVTKEGRRLPYSQSLDTLVTKLNTDQFFRANRQIILSHGIIETMMSIEYGKIRVNLSKGNGYPENVIISRTRAAEFRKWLRNQVA
ncbi:MAG: LytTR family transcriptional regulator DNA-binding domain-containing protein [Cyclobacteriaceae bacterium]